MLGNAARPETNESPHSNEAERAVLGAVLIDANTWPTVSHLTAEDFYRADHRAIYSALSGFVEAGEPMDVVTVAERLEQDGTLEAAGGLAYVAELAENTPSAANAGAYAGIVRERADRRRAMTLAMDVHTAARTGTDGEGNAVSARRLADRFMGGLAALAEDAGGAPARRALPVPSVTTELPARRLAAAGQGGAVLSAGTVAVLAGEGGIGKSALAGSIALGIAMLPAGESGDVSGGLFEGDGGPVLLASLEDEPAVTAWRLRKLAGILDAGGGRSASEALKRVHVLDLAGRPLFGPRDDGRGALYGARPERLAGWWDFWREADRIKPRLVVVDPALSAYVGEPNAAAPVTEFLVALASEAKARGVGVLLAAHSTKAARKGKGEAPDPFEPGQVAGTAAWTDRARGVLSFTWGKGAGARVLAIPKANYGPARIQIGLEPIRDRRQGIVGFAARGQWGKDAPAGAGKVPGV